MALTDGTDAKTFRRGHPLLLAETPSPFGHEFAGIDVATGRRVVAANSAPCGACPACVRGEETLCENRPFLNGAYAEYVLVPERIAERNMLPFRMRCPRTSPRWWSRSLAACTEWRRAEIEADKRSPCSGSADRPHALRCGQGRRRARGRGRRATRAPRARPAFGAGARTTAKELTSSSRRQGARLAWRDAVDLVRKGGVVLFFGGRERGSELAVDTYRLHYED